MGLGNVFLNDLIELKQKGALDGATRVMEIGAQQISDSLMIAPALPEAYRLFGCTSPPVLTPVGTENFTKSAPSSAPFWSARSIWANTPTTSPAKTCTTARRATRTIRPG